jgi:phosphoadenosine phosphosulfate reductase
MWETQDLVDESIAFLREHVPPEGYFVGFSGGKDSIVTLELCRMAGVKHQAYYSCTGIDAPEMYRFIRKYYPEVVWMHPKMTFWEGIRKKSPPTIHRRWCCDLLKKNPAKHIPLKHRLMGIRAEESYRRANRPRIDPYNKKQVLYKPIFNWLEWNIWEFIDGNRLPYPCLYDEGFSRIGCAVCPFSCSSKAKLERNKARWPQVYKVFELVVKDWFLHHRTQQKPGTWQEYLRFWYSGKAVSRADEQVELWG